MNIKKNGVILFLLAILLTGCSGKNVSLIYSDNNKISSSADTFNIDIKEQKIDGEKFVGIIKKIEGIDTIWTYEAEEDKKLDMKYLLNVRKGKVKLVLISPDNTITNIIERTNESPITNYATSTIQIKKGFNRIKLVAEKKSSGEFDIEIPCGNFKELGL
ncbi:MAG: 50S ribosomal protein L7ae [Clostridium sartagoforme]|nr:50S ribosomal protein L7ae [Clostridium sartagoforme]